jgi:hypothetical protein
MSNNEFISVNSWLSDPWIDAFGHFIKRDVIATTQPENSRFIYLSCLIYTKMKQLRVCHERNNGIGGTWYGNDIILWTRSRYPNAEHLLTVTVTIVNISSTHWYAVALVPPGHALQKYTGVGEPTHVEFHILDGFFPTRTTRKTTKKVTDHYTYVCNTFQEWYKQERRRYGLDAVGWTVVYHDDYYNTDARLADINQTDGVSCGVSAIWHVHYLLLCKRFAKKSDFSYDNILECRWALVDRLLQYTDGRSRGQAITLLDDAETEMGVNDLINDEKVDEKEENRKYKEDMELAKALSRKENELTRSQILDSQRYIVDLTQDTIKLK